MLANLLGHTLQTLESIEPPLIMMCSIGAPAAACASMIWRNP